ncbi:MAG: hypothetical protein PHS14_16945 [Elusimicrobia bacterium]|nr:hypothetical protein [Elusimicrobiota bacterium]
MLDRWVQTDPKAAIERVETMVMVLEKLRIASIKATYPSDWIIHTSTTRDGQILTQKGYLQDSGAERAGKVWGIEVGNPAIEREDFPLDSTYSYHMIAEAWSKVTGERLDYAEGSRWSGDPFFARQGDKVDPTDVRKAAYANLHGRAVRALSGLNGVPLDTLRQAGIDVAKVVHVNYQPGEKSSASTGAATVGSAEAIIGFGNSKGKAVSELETKDLDWYIKAYGENVADAAKAKFKVANQRVLDALNAEKEKRAQSASHEAETGTKAPEKGAAIEDGTPRGKLIGDVWTRLTDAAGQHAIGLLQELTTEYLKQPTGKLSDLTDEQLKLLAAIPEQALAAAAKALAGKK